MSVFSPSHSFGEGRLRQDYMEACFGTEDKQKLHSPQGSLLQLPGSVPENWQHYTRAQLQKTGSVHVFAVLILIGLQWDGSIKRNWQWPKDRLFWSWLNWVLLWIISTSSTSLIWVEQMLHKNTSLPQYASTEIDRWSAKGFRQLFQLSVWRRFPFPVEKCSNAIACSLYPILYWLLYSSSWDQ